MREEPEESGLARRQTLVLLTVAAVWLVLVYTLPKGWSWLAGLAGMAAYCVWAMRQEHPPHPSGAFGHLRQRQIRIEIDKALAGLDRPRPGKVLLRPAETGADDDRLLRPAPGDSAHEPERLLRSASEPADE